MKNETREAFTQLLTRIAELNGIRDTTQSVSIPRQSRGLYIVSPSKGQESEPPEGGCLTFQT
ncbi:hypothetical protein [Halomonas sp.]|uniref:hypothetical protein n=1 Tax=Halomonas sp. TaxID=1486246 RepID=UPI00298EC793|nr:hypothetical protein [Halomonas sp.]MDW7746728.1 hypothetical protein [Halomonas sp.]